jgi:hypothetical protein
MNLGDHENGLESSSQKPQMTRPTTAQKPRRLPQSIAMPPLLGTGVDVEVAKDRRGSAATAPGGTVLMSQKTESHRRSA